MWIGWILIGVVVNAVMGSSASGGDYNTLQGFIFLAGLIGGPAAILIYRNRCGVFLNVEGTGSRITSIEIGPYNSSTESRAYAIADELIESAEYNASPRFNYQSEARY